MNGLINSKIELRIPDFLMPMRVKADEVEYTFNINQSNICVDNHGTQICGGYKDNPYDDNLNYPLELIKYRVKLNDGWLKDNVYTLNVGYKPTPDAIHVSSLSVCWENSGDCETYTSQNGWNKNSSGYYRNIFSFSPTVDHSSNEYLNIFVRFIPGYLTTIRPSLLNTLSVARGTDAIIKDQTNQIIEGQEELKDILEGEHDYNKDPSEEINGKEDINNYTEKEEELFGRLDFEGIGNNEITINPQASSFIWQIVERIREMNGKIVLFMTSILGIGIIKMILNR